MKEIKNKKSDGKVGKISIEKLNHFQCGYCLGWWSVGDAPKRDFWYCAWCGKKQTFRDVTPKVISR